MRILVSVRDVHEALLAAAPGGADFIDLKDPAAGALGGLPPATIAAVVQALRQAGSRLKTSATIGDLPMDDVPAIVQRAQAVAACGVDYVKVGIERAPGAEAVLQALAATGLPVIPVFVADAGLDLARVQQALRLAQAGIMVDTQGKAAGSLFDRLDAATLARFVAMAREAGVMVGAAGALRLADLPRLVALGPDYAGFRSAVCEGHRAGALSAGKLQALAGSLRAAAAAARPVAATAPEVARA